MSNGANFTIDYLNHQLIPYIGNKRSLKDLLLKSINFTNAKPGDIFLDIFAGSGFVSRLAKNMNFRVYSNDWEPYSREINRCYIECNKNPSFNHINNSTGYLECIKHLNACESKEDWVTKHLCPSDDISYDIETDRMFYMKKTGMRIDAIRSEIENMNNLKQINYLEKACLLSPLLFQASYCSNTSGVFKGFHNGWGGKTKTALSRIMSDLMLSPAIFYDNGLENKVFCEDGLDLVKKFIAEKSNVNLTYIDPPYNQHSYGSNYHVLNTLTLWDNPELTEKIDVKLRNKAAIRLDWRTDRKSAYNYKNTATNAYIDLIHNLSRISNFILTSYSSDGLIPLKDLINVNYEVGKLNYFLKENQRYVVSSTRKSDRLINTEYILVTETNRKNTKSKDEIYDDLTTEKLKIDTKSLQIN